MKKVKTTTAYPDYECDYDCLYEAYGGPSENWEYKEYEAPMEFDSEQMVSIGAVFRSIDDVASFIGFFINIIHFLILIRRELRTNFVYIIMMGICFCDMIVSASKVLSNSLEWNIFYTLEENCGRARPYFHVMIQWVGYAVQATCRQTSSSLAFSMTAYRALSVIFPMSSFVHNLMKPGSAILTFFVCFACFGALSTAVYTRATIEKEKDCKGPSRYAQYDLYGSEELEYVHNIIIGYHALIMSVLYVLATLALVCELRKAQRRRKNLKTDRADNTTNLVILMAVTFFVCEASYGVIYILDAHVLQYYSYVQWHVKQLYVLPETLITVNSTIHCFICFLMSSQYRDAIKRLVYEDSRTTSAVVFVGPASSASTLKTSSEKSSIGSRY